jgi:hypothetical protein
LKVYAIRWAEGAREDMKRMKLRAYEVGQIVDSVDGQLSHEPDQQTKHKKIIRPGEQLPFEHGEPVWQLSVGDFRIFYDITKSSDENPMPKDTEGLVSIRAVRRKPSHKTTKEIL